MFASCRLHSHPSPIIATSWLKSLEVNGALCQVDCSNVVLSHGKGYIHGKTRCGLCGSRGGLKARCLDIDCRARGERRAPYLFHVTCARQAGFEVWHDDHQDEGDEFYGTSTAGSRSALMGNDHFLISFVTSFCSSLLQTRWK
jgi:hypothetical protein